MRDGFEEREQLYYEQLQKSLHAGLAIPDFYQTIVDAPFNDPLAATYLELGIVELLLVNKNGKVITHAALSNTELARIAVKTSQKPFKDIKIPLSDKDNLITKAIKTGTSQRTEDWKDIFVPVLSSESARFNQSSAGIACSVIEPIKGKPQAALLFSFFQYPKDSEHTARFTSIYASMVSDALDLATSKSKL